MTNASNELHQMVTAQVEREQVLINNRISWMLTFEGFLFAGLALAGDSKSTPEFRRAIKETFPLVGATVAVLTVFGVLAATLAIVNAKTFWKNLVGTAGFPTPHGSLTASILGRATSFGVPIAVAVAWVVISAKL